MAKLSSLDKAIASLEAERQIVDMAIARLKAQQEPPAKAKASRGRKFEDAAAKIADGAK